MPRQNKHRRTKSPPSFQPSILQGVRRNIEEKPPLASKTEKIAPNDHFVFGHAKSNSLIFPYQGGPGSRLENSFNNLNSSKQQTENSKVTHIEGDNDIIDLDSSNSVKSYDNPEIIKGPIPLTTWTGEHSPVQFNPKGPQNDGKDNSSGSGRKLMTPNPMFFKEGLTTQTNQDLVLVHSSAIKFTPGPDSKFGISQNSQSIDYEQLFRLRDDYIFSCDDKHMYMYNLKRQQQTIVEIEGGPLFAHKQQICRIQQLPNEVAQFNLASVDDLSFKPIGVVQTNMRETQFCQLQKQFTILLSSREKVFSIKVLKPKIKVTGLPNLNFARVQHTIVQAADATILVIGGISFPEKIPLQNIEVFRLGQAEWQLCSLNLPLPLSQMSSVSHPEGVLLFGGVDSAGIIRKECYKLVGTRQLISLAPLPLLPHHLASVSTATFDEVYLMSEKQVLVYNTRKNFWLADNNISPHSVRGAALVQF